MALFQHDPTGPEFRTLRCFFSPPVAPPAHWWQEPLELAASWLQVQLEVANHTAALDLEGLDATGKALVLQGWSLLTSAAKPGSQDSHGFQLPIWACILGLILILAMMFYLVNFMLWARREKAQRVHDLEDAKMHSEHGNLLGGLIEAGSRTSCVEVAWYFLWRK